jgi:hypothetical protein
VFLVVSLLWTGRRVVARGRFHPGPHDRSVPFTPGDETLIGIDHDVFRLI